MSFLYGNPGITDPEWSEEDGVTYFKDDFDNPTNPKDWDLSWSADWLQPPAAQPQAAGTGPARGTGSIAAMSAAQFNAFVDSLPDDLDQFNAVIDMMSDAEYATFRQRSAALPKNQGGQTEYGPGGWATLGSELGDTAKGFLWDGPKSFVGGIYDLATTNPLTTLGNISSAIWNYDQTAKSLLDDLLNKTQSSSGRGQLAFDAWFGVLSGAATAKYGPKITEKVKSLFPKPVVAKIAELSRAAGVHHSEGLSVAGHALQKHAGRPGSAFPKVTGPPSNWSAAAQKIVDNILNNPSSTFTDRIAGRFGKVLDVRAPDGRGVRFSFDGSFIHFLEPPR